MEEYFDNSEQLNNISQGADRIARLKNQKSWAIVGCILLTGFIVLAIYLDHEEQKKAALI